MTPTERAAAVLAEHAMREDDNGGAICVPGDWRGPWTFGEPEAHQAAMLAAAGLLVPDPVDDDALVEAVAACLRDIDSGGPDPLNHPGETRAVHDARFPVTDDTRHDARAVLAIPALRARLAAGDDAQALADAIYELAVRSLGQGHGEAVPAGLLFDLLAARSAATTDEETDRG